MAETLKRYNGPEELIDLGQWTHPLRHIEGCMATIVVCCPHCGQRSTLTKDYKVETGTGIVSPCFTCNGCKWLEFLVLADWGRPVC